jgi:hypothetical protein
MYRGPMDTTHPIVRELLQERLAHRDEQGITLARRLRGEKSLVDGRIDGAAETCFFEVSPLQPDRIFVFVAEKGALGGTEWRPARQIRDTCSTVEEA